MFLGQGSQSLQKQMHLNQPKSLLFVKFFFLFDLICRLIHKTEIT